MAHWSRYASRMSSDTNLWGRPRTAGVYPFANSNELSSLDPEKTFDRKVALAIIVASEAVVSSCCNRSKICLMVAFFRSTTPVLLCLRTGRSSGEMECANRNFRIAFVWNSASLANEHGAPCRRIHIVSRPLVMASADRFEQIEVSEYDVAASTACSTQYREFRITQNT